MARKREVPKLDANGLWEYALRALARRALAAGELRVRLERRAQSGDLVPGVLARLKEYGYLDDRRFAETYAAARKENQGLGRIRVLRDLRVRRVAPALAEQAVKQAYAGSDETALVEDFLRRKFRNRNLPEYLSKEKNLASAYRKLRYAGFSPGVAIRVLKKYSDRAEELEETDEKSGE